MALNHLIASVDFWNRLNKKEAAEYKTGYCKSWHIAGAQKKAMLNPAEAKPTHRGTSGDMSVLESP